MNHYDCDGCTKEVSHGICVIIGPDRDVIRKILVDDIPGHVVLRYHNRCMAKDLPKHLRLTSNWVPPHDQAARFAEARAHF